jgi:anti-sigma factor RsiW
MAHEIDKEKLTAFLDGELPPADLEALKAHLASCPECSAYLERIKQASADFREHGAEKIPAGVLNAALKQAATKKRVHKDLSPAVKLIIALAALTIFVFVSGAFAKRFMPGLFGQIQGMISGAASNLGQ